MRPRLARVAAGWLILHFCLLVSVPAALCSMNSAVIALVECTCAHGDGQTCPMHRTESKSKPAPVSNTCSCRSASDPAAELASSLIGPTAVLALSASISAPISTAAWIRTFNPAPLESPSVPDSPPPRG